MMSPLPKENNHFLLRGIRHLGRSATLARSGSSTQVDDPESVVCQPTNSDLR
jgi:hypothetical protein